MSRFLQIFILMLSLCCPSGSVANEMIANSQAWVMGTEGVLEQTLTQKIAKILAQTAKNENIDVRVFLVNDAQAPAIETIARNLVDEWQLRHPGVAKERAEKVTAYLVINVLTDESRIVLGENITQTPAMIETLRTIQERIILPALAIDNVSKATLEGVTALVSSLEKWPGPQVPTLLQKLFDFFMSIRYFIVFALFLALAVFLKRYLQSPKWEIPTDSEVQLILNKAPFYSQRDEHNNGLYEYS